MIVAILRSRMNPEAQEEEYMKCSARMGELAVTMPGYVSHKGFVAKDGERVTLVEFETEDGVRAWAVHPEHVAAKKKRKIFFSEFRVQVCTTRRDGAIPRR